MAETLDPEELVTIEELLVSDMFECPDKGVGSLYQAMLPWDERLQGQFVA